MTEINKAKKEISFSKRYTTDYKEYLKHREGGTDKETGNKIVLSYLSWATAHRILKELDPYSEIIEREFSHFSVLSGQHQDFLVEETKPYRQVGKGYMVKVSVILYGKEETENYPVINYRGMSVPDPSSTDISKALKRAFVKALAKHGIALYLYEGEDVAEAPKIDVKTIETLIKLVNSFADKSGKDQTEWLIERVNKYTENDPMIGKKVSSIEDLTFEQAGVFKNELAYLSNKYDEKIKAEKKEEKAKK